MTAPKSIPFLVTMVASGRQYVVYAASQAAADTFFRTTEECDGTFRLEPYQEALIAILDERKAPGA